MAISDYALAPMTGMAKSGSHSVFRLFRGWQEDGIGLRLKACAGLMARVRCALQIRMVIPLFR